MPTISQLVKKGRTPKRRRDKAPALKGAPQKRGTVIRCTVVNPKKPNSANRVVARVPSHTLRRLYYRTVMKFRIGSGSSIFLDAWFDARRNFAACISSAPGCDPRWWPPGALGDRLMATRPASS